MILDIFFATVKDWMYFPYFTKYFIQTEPIMNKLIRLTFEHHHIHQALPNVISYSSEIHVAF